MIFYALFRFFSFHQSGNFWSDILNFIHDINFSAALKRNLEIENLNVEDNKEKDNNGKQ